MELALEYMIITGALVVAGLYLEKWEPPIKKQYVAMVLFVLGAILGYFQVDNCLYGVLIAGLVYYKKELVEEVKAITDSFKNIKDDITDLK